MALEHDDYEGGNMGAYLMARTREDTRQFKQGYAPASKPAPATEHPVVTSYREWRTDFIARRKG